jgi:hypothetical protein
MKGAFTTADTEDTEVAQRRRCKPLCVLCVLCVSVVNLAIPGIQDKTGPLPERCQRIEQFRFFIFGDGSQVQ